MSEERTRILDMVAAGKISVAEAEELLNALESHRGDREPVGGLVKGTGSPKNVPKFFRVVIDSTDGDNVDVRIPFGLLKAGIRLSSLMPPQVAQKISKHLAGKGMEVDLSHVRKEDIDDFLSTFSELEINVDGSSGEKIRVFCE